MMGVGAANFTLRAFAPLVFPTRMPASPTPLIELNRASVIRGQVRVLHELDLRIEQGQHTAILGPNGCGKSSFIKLITRELYPLARADGLPPVQVLGQTRWQVDRLRAQLGIVTGDLSGNLADMPGLGVEEAVISGFFASYVVPAHRDVTDDMRQRARHALELARASSLLGRSYAELSAGETRRVLIARALVNQPRALLLDEPSTGPPNTSDNGPARSRSARSPSAKMRPPFISTTRRISGITSSMWWVTSTRVMPCCARWRMVSTRCWRAIKSSPVEGSSSSKARGWLTSARAISTRRVSPADSSA